MNEPEDEKTRREREAREREDELRRIPIAEIDKTKWPANVRVISMHETGGLGVDPSGSFGCCVHRGCAPLRLYL
ncbi:MAG: hypothetical protein ACM3IH_16255 [Sphingobacteriales bacterium]